MQTFHEKFQKFLKVLLENFRRTFLGIPCYLSQLLSLVPNLFARKVAKNSNQSHIVIIKNVEDFERNFVPNFASNPQVLIPRNRKVLDDLQLTIFTKYFLYPYHFSCWYLSSYRMILQNQFYASINSARKFAGNFKRKLCVNFIYQITGFYYRLRFA